jgi:integrase
MTSDYFSDVKRLYGTREAEKFKTVIPFGNIKITLFKLSADVGSSWYFKIRLKGERQYYKRSLRTSDIAEAKSAAMSAVVDILAAQKAGEAIVSPPIQDVLRKFKIHLESRHAQRTLAKATVAKNTQRLKYLERFLKERLASGLATKIGSIDGSIWKDYSDWRTQYSARQIQRPVRERTVSQKTIFDDLVHIKAFFVWAIKKNYAPNRCLPQWDEFKPNESKRKPITPHDYRVAIASLSSWANREDESGRDNSYTRSQTYYKQLIFHLFLTMVASGMRTGEALQLRNRDLEINHKEQLIQVHIRSETSKIKKDRTINLRPAPPYDSDDNTENFLLRWIKIHQIHKEKDDIVFSQYPKSATAYNVVYKTWRIFRDEVLVKKNLQFFDLYYARHQFITTAIRNGANVYNVAKTCGTSIKQIQATYDHVLSQTASDDVFEKRREIAEKSRQKRRS